MSSAYYSPNWKKSDSLLFYYDRRFTYRPEIIIVQLDDCLITSKSIAYYNRKIVDNDELIGVVPDIYEPELWTRLRRETQSAKSIVIMCNAHSSQRQLIDNLKFKTEYIIELLDRPVIALFSLLPNRYMKPHSGMFRFLQALYKREGKSIDAVQVVSQDGGIISGGQMKTTDVDRAFAANISLLLGNERAVFLTVNEYIGGPSDQFAWDTTIVGPELRPTIITQLDKFRPAATNTSLPMNLIEQSVRGWNTQRLTNENTREAAVYRHVERHADCWIIAVSGAPRSGRTTFATNFIDMWNEESIGRHHAIEYFEYVQGKVFWRRIFELCKSGISVVIDGLPPTHAARQPILDYLDSADQAKNIVADDIFDRCISKTRRYKQDYGDHYMQHKKKTIVIRPRDDVAAVFVEINCSMAMAQLFNHVAVELAKSEIVRLVKQEEYAFYRAAYEPLNTHHPRVYHHVHVPQIMPSVELMQFRY